MPLVHSSVSRLLKHLRNRLWHANLSFGNWRVKTPAQGLEQVSGNHVYGTSARGSVPAIWCREVPDPGCSRRRNVSKPAVRTMPKGEQQMTALDATTPAGRALRPWQDPTLPVAARVDALLAEMTLEEKVGQLGSRWVGNDDACPPTNPSRPLIPRPAARRMWRRCRTCSRPPGRSLSRRRCRARARPSDPGVRQRAGDRGRKAPRRWSGCSARSWSVPARRPGARPRGVPHRLHHLRRDRLSRGHRLGRDVRPRPGGADGRRDRARHARRGRAPGPVPGARRRARLPLGPGRGDDGRGPATSSRCSAPPTSAAWRTPGSSPRSSTSPATPPRGRPATTAPSRWAAAS